MTTSHSVEQSRFRINGLDLRALSAFRIVVGLNVIYNLLKYRFFAGGLFYTSDGLMDTATAQAFYGDLFSIINLFPSQGFVLFFFSLTFVLAVLYVVGIKARWVAPLLFFCFGNVITANPWTVHAVEFLIEASLFWSIFLPIDQHFALMPGKRVSAPGNNLRTFPVFALLIQIAFVYFTSGITKSGEYWQEGLTVLSVTDDRMHSAFLAGWLATQPGLCAFLSYSTIFVEVLIGILIFSPVFNTTFRWIFALTIPCLHFGLAMGMDVGPFHWITLAFAIVLLPAFVWDKFVALLPAKGKKRKKHKVKAASTSPSWQTWSVRIFLGLMLIGISLQNLKKWERDSYLSPAINAIGPLDALAEMELPSPQIFIGLWSQPWWTFSPNPHEQMGCLLILGRTAQGTSIDLVSGRNFTFSQDPISGQPVFSEEPHNQFKRTHFVFAWYVRRYLNSMPKPLLQRWVNEVQSEYNRTHPQQRVVQSGLFFYSNLTSLVNGQITRDKNFYQIQL